MYSTVHSPVYANADGTAINLMVQFDRLPVEVPFTASPDDIEAHGRELFTRAEAGDFGAVAAYTPPPAN